MVMEITRAMKETIPILSYQKNCKETHNMIRTHNKTVWLDLAQRKAYDKQLKVQL